MSGHKVLWPVLMDTTCSSGSTGHRNKGPRPDESLKLGTLVPAVTTKGQKAGRVTIPVGYCKQVCGEPPHSSIRISSTEIKAVEVPFSTLLAGPESSPVALK